MGVAINLIHRATFSYSDCGGMRAFSITTTEGDIYSDCGGMRAFSISIEVYYLWYQCFP